MPIYQYEFADDDAEDGRLLEFLQGMHDPPLERDPESGRPIRRVIGAPRVPRKWSDARMQANLSDSNLERLGFTKYQKSGDGTYEKRVGQGPDVISAD